MKKKGHGKEKRIRASLGPVWSASVVRPSNFRTSNEITRTPSLRFVPPFMRISSLSSFLLSFERLINICEYFDVRTRTLTSMQTHADTRHHTTSHTHTRTHTLDTCVKPNKRSVLRPLQRTLPRSNASRVLLRERKIRRIRVRVICA